MAEFWYPVINTDLCIECGTCVGWCKHGVYKKGTNVPVVIYPDGCVQGCKGCGKKCPVGAISYVVDTNYDASDCGCGCDTDKTVKKDNCGCGGSCGCD